MTTPKPPKKVKAPEGSFIDITAGKVYDVISVWGEFTELYGFGFDIIDDSGFKISICENKNIHVNNLDWIVTEREE